MYARATRAIAVWLADAGRGRRTVIAVAAAVCGLYLFARIGLEQATVNGVLYVAVAGVAARFGWRGGVVIAIVCAALVTVAQQIDPTPLPPGVATHPTVATLSRAIGYVVVGPVVGVMADVANALYRLAESDELTGLLNKRTFADDLVKHAEWIQRYGPTGALVMIDLDGFKRANDAHGHRVGDQILAEVADVLHDATRRTDRLARVGGDEFAILLPESDEDAAERTAGRICKALAAKRWPREARITASVGVTAFRLGTDVDDLLQIADEAMYRAKRDGGNRWETGHRLGEDRKPLRRAGDHA